MSKEQILLSEVNGAPIILTSDNDSISLNTTIEELISILRQKIKLLYNQDINDNITIQSPTYLNSTDGFCNSETIKTLDSSVILGNLRTSIITVKSEESEEESKNVLYFLIKLDKLQQFTQNSGHSEGKLVTTYPKQRQVAWKLFKAAQSALEISSKTSFRDKFPEGVAYLILLPRFNNLVNQTRSRMNSLDLNPECVSQFSLQGQHIGKFHKFVKSAKTRNQKLHVLIVDECHWGIQKNNDGNGGTQDKLLHSFGLQNLENVLYLLVSATPYNVLSSKSRIPQRYKYLSNSDDTIQIDGKLDFNNLRGDINYSVELNVVDWFDEQDIFDENTALIKDSTPYCRLEYQLRCLISRWQYDSYYENMIEQFYDKASKEISFIGVTVSAPSDFKKKETTRKIKVAAIRFWVYLIDMVVSYLFVKLVRNHPQGSNNYAEFWSTYRYIADNFGRSQILQKMKTLILPNNYDVHFCNAMNFYKEEWSRIIGSRKEHDMVIARYNAKILPFSSEFIIYTLLSDKKMVVSRVGNTNDSCIITCAFMFVKNVLGDDVFMIYQSNNAFPLSSYDDKYIQGIKNEKYRKEFQKKVRNPIHCTSKELFRISRDITKNIHVSFEDLENVPCILFLINQARMGDTFPSSFSIFDLRIQSGDNFTLSTFEQEVGRTCKYLDSPEKLPIVMFSKTRYTLLHDAYKDFLINGKSFPPHIPSAIWGVNGRIDKLLEGAIISLKNKHKIAQPYRFNDPEETSYDYESKEVHQRRILLRAEPQIGKTNTYLYFIKLLQFATSQTFEDSGEVGENITLDCDEYFSKFFLIDYPLFPVLSYYNRCDNNRGNSTYFSDPSYSNSYYIENRKKFVNQFYDDEKEIWINNYINRVKSIDEECIWSKSGLKKLEDLKKLITDKIPTGEIKKKLIRWDRPLISSEMLNNVSNINEKKFHNSNNNNNKNNIQLTEDNDIEVRTIKIDETIKERCTNIDDLDDDNYNNDVSNHRCDLYYYVITNELMKERGIKRITICDEENKYDITTIKVSVPSHISKMNVITYIEDNDKEKNLSKKIITEVKSKPEGNDSFISYWIFTECNTHSRTLNFKNKFAENINYIHALVVEDCNFEDFVQLFGSTHIIITLPRNWHVTSPNLTETSLMKMGYTRLFIQILSYLWKMEYIWIIDEKLIYCTKLDTISPSESSTVSPNQVICDQMVIKYCPISDPIILIESLTLKSFELPSDQRDLYVELLSLLNIINDDEPLSMERYYQEFRDRCAVMGMVHGGSPHSYSPFMYNYCKRNKQPLFSSAFNLKHFILVNVKLTIGADILMNPKLRGMEYEFNQQCLDNNYLVVKFQKFSYSLKRRISESSPPLKIFWKWKYTTKMIKETTFNSTNNDDILSRPLFDTPFDKNLITVRSLSSATP